MTRVTFAAYNALCRSTGPVADTVTYDVASWFSMTSELRRSYKVDVKLEPFYSGGGAAVSRNGKLVACACYEDVKVVERAAGQLVKTLSADSEPITAIAWGVNGSLFAASRSLQLRCWESSDWTCLRSWTAHSAAITSLAVDASGNILVSGSADKTVRAWNVEGFYCTHVFRGHKSVVLQVIVLSQQLQVVSSSEDGEVRVWDLVGQSCKAILSGHESAVTALSASSDSKTLLTAGRDKIAILWSAENFTKHNTVPVFEAVEGAVLLSSEVEGHSSCFASAGERGVVKLWDSHTGKLLAEQVLEGPMEEGSQLTSLQQLPYGQLMATSEDGKLQFVDPRVHSGAEASTSGRLHVVKELIGSHGEITDLRILGNPGSAQYVAVATNSSVVRLYEAQTGRLAASLYGHSDVVLAMDVLQLDDSTSLLVSGSKDMTFRIWRLQQESKIGKKKKSTAAAAAVSSKLLAAVTGHSAAVTAVCLSLKASVLSLVTGSSDKLIKVWDLTKVAAGEGGAVTELESVAAVQAHAKDINSLSVSHNGSLICSASQDKLAKTWRLPTLVQHLTFSGHKRGIWSAVFSSVEQIVATASGDKTIKLWSLSTGACLRTLQGHTSSVLKLYYLPSGLQIMSVGSDGLMKLWNVRTSECVATLEEHEGKVWALAGSSDKLIVSGGADAVLCIWHDATQSMLEEASHQQTARTEASQALANALQEGRLQHAARLALDSGHAKSLLTVLDRAQELSDSDRTTFFSDLVSDLPEDKLKQIVEWARDWNTNSKRWSHAQILLHAILQSRKPKELSELAGLQDILAAIQPYTERHIAHLDRLLCSSYLLDYSLSRLDDTFEA